MVDRAAVAEYFQASEQTYRFLAQMFFCELNEQAIAELATQDWPSDTGNDALDKGYGQVRRYFRFASSDMRTQLAVEYARIFLAAGVFGADTLSAVPYESVFTSEEHIMMRASRDDVVRFFAADGFKVDSSLHEPEDHLSFELEYLSHMSARALETLDADNTLALSNNIARQIAFIDAHLLNWVGQLHDVAQDYAKTTFYTGMLLVAQGALEQSRAWLSDLSDELAGGDARLVKSA